ncbi:hypothetical protein CVD28_15270 [Bacillus sp. M6-12]|uniref:PilZ domain-containing protein n=1 Tax=Bacillus sp. M6-12 TaxID=2054166 RepID=UPI000C7705D7|nr:PilZ domain-containing protein [Bacillus sp. M6-12]PLS16448.1 hypothetical protein CVD28_15270 [Bacillus sp. M6-12]
MESIQLMANGEATQGALFFIEGELINIIVKDVDRFQIGQSVTCISDSGQFTTKIIKKHNFNLYLYLPMTEQLMNENRRKAARCELKVPATINIIDTTLESEIIDISIQGLAFQLSALLGEESELKIAFPILEQMVTCGIEVKNQNEMGNGCVRCGSLITTISEESRFQIRRYILMEQLKKIEEESQQLDPGIA